MVNGWSIFVDKIHESVETTAHPVGGGYTTYVANVRNGCMVLSQEWDTPSLGKFRVENDDGPIVLYRPVSVISKPSRDVFVGFQPRNKIFWVREWALLCSSDNMKAEKKRKKIAAAIFLRVYLSGYITWIMEHELFLGIPLTSSSKACCSTLLWGSANWSLEATTSAEKMDTVGIWRRDLLELSWNEGNQVALNHPFSSSIFP